MISNEVVLLLNKGVSPLHTQQNRTLKTEFCSGETEVIYCHGAKPGEQEAIALNLNSPMAFDQGFLKAEVEG